MKITLCYFVHVHLVCAVAKVMHYAIQQTPVHFILFFKVWIKGADEMPVMDLFGHADTYVDAWVSAGHETEMMDNKVKQCMNSIHKVRQNAESFVFKSKLQA